MRRIIPIALSLVLIQPVLASDDFDFPPDIVGPIHPAGKQMMKRIQALQWAKQEDVWKLGDQVEEELKGKLKALERKFEGTQESQIDFRISEGKIVNVEITTFAKDPAFDYLVKKMVLSLDGKPLLRLPKRVPKLQIMVSATFTKSPTATSVFVKARQSRWAEHPSARPTQNRLLNKMNR